MLSELQGKRLSEYCDSYVVFDLETTGLSANFDEVVEISAIKVIDGEIVDEFSTLVNPGMPIPRSASQVNGITNAMVKNSPCFKEALGQFIDFIEDLPLVGHNIICFDLKFIYRDCQKYFHQSIDNDFADTLYLSRKALPGLGHYTLVDLSNYYHISSAGAHRALNDCRMNQQVYECLVKEKNNPFEKEDIRICPRCGCVMKKRVGKFGVFYGCSGYPVCKYTCNC